MTTIDKEKNFSGTVAIDLGNTNTVISFQGEESINSDLIEMPEISSSPGIVPTAIWFDKKSNLTKIGVSAFEMKKKQNSDKFFYSNFKRLIGNPFENNHNNNVSPTECGEKFFKVLWENIPQEYLVKRLVLTAPIDTYKGYRQWLLSLCAELPVKEIALVDEPTAAALGINVPFGSKIMTIDIGGSTIDMNIVQLEGGEGKAAPIAELLKFKGKDVSSISKQKIRSAKVISKVGSKIGGKDIDQWIVNYLSPLNKNYRNLLKAEELKCYLSSPEVIDEKKYPITLLLDKNEEKEFFLSKEEFEMILKKNNFINHLNSLLKDLLNEARGNFCNVDELYSIILVGGGTQIPLIKEWIRESIPDITIKSPPPIESIALGALRMTPGVQIKDVLSKGISIKLVNKREQKNLWHPIFFKGQTWPTEKPFKLILQASKSNQQKFNIIIGETQKEREYDIIFENGIPILSDIQSEEKIIQWQKKPLQINLRKKYELGEDILKLFFRITKNGDLYVKCFDNQEKELGDFSLGSIF